MIKKLEFKIFAEKYLPPFHEIFVQEIPIQKCFGPELFYLSTDFQNVCCTICDKLMLNCAKKIFLLYLNSCKISAKNHYHTLRNRL